MRSFPLPAYFATYGIMLATLIDVGWTFQLHPATLGRWSSPGDPWILIDVIALPVAAYLTIREAKRRKLADADQDRYWAAVCTGEPGGDVSSWAEWIERDHDEVRALAITSVLGVGWWGVQALLYGPWWAGADMVLLAACVGWLAWQSMRNLQTLSRYSGPPRS